MKLYGEYGKRVGCERGVREREGKRGVRVLELGGARGERWCERGRVE